MTTMNISVPDEMKAFVEAEMAQEGYASASEYLRALIRDAQKRQAQAGSGSQTPRGAARAGGRDDSRRLGLD